MEQDDRAAQDVDRKRKCDWYDEDGMGVAPYKENGHDDDDDDDDEMIFVRGASPTIKSRHIENKSPPSSNNLHLFNEQGRPHDDTYESYDEHNSNDGFPRFSVDAPTRSTNGAALKRRKQDGKNQGHRDKKKKKRKKKEKHGHKHHHHDDDQAKPICSFYMKGKCYKGAECSYSHSATPFRKMELCKFYLMDCCSKNDRCLYMHQDFPCKYYHVGARCFSGSKCKFSHGELTSTMRSVLLKHLELNQDELLQQDSLRDSHKVNNRRHGDKTRTEEENVRILISQSPKLEGKSPVKSNGHQWNNNENSFSHERYPRNSNDEYKHKGNVSSGDDHEGEVRSLPRFYQDTLVSDEDEGSTGGRSLHQRASSSSHPSVPDDGRNKSLSRVDNLVMEFTAGKKRVVRKESKKPSMDCQRESPPGPGSKVDDGGRIPLHIPRKQQELFLRIQQQQRKANSSQEERNNDGEDETDRRREENWYSSDEEEGSTLASVLRKLKRQDHRDNPKTAPGSASSTSSPTSTAGKMSSDVTEPVTKLLFTLRNQNNSESSSTTSAGRPMTPPRDPRNRNVMAARCSPGHDRRGDPRKAPSSSDVRHPRGGGGSDSGNAPLSPVFISIYSNAITSDIFQTTRLGLNLPGRNDDDDLKSCLSRRKGESRSDVGVRTSDDARLGGTNMVGADVRDKGDVDTSRMLNLPFKPAPLHTPATEIYASETSHLPMAYEVVPVQIPTPDYRHLRFKSSDAQIYSDPRLRKLYKLSRTPSSCTSPTMNLSSSLPPPVARSDPRRRNSQQ